MRFGWVVVVGVAGGGGAGCGRVAFDAIDVEPDALMRPASTCAGQSVLLCEGFDEPTFATNWVQEESVGGLLSIDTGVAHRGPSAMRAEVTSGTGLAMPKAELRNTQGLLGDTTARMLYVRLWASFRAPLDDEFHQFITLSDTTGVGISLGVRNGHVTMNDFTELVLKESQTVALPTSTFVCLRFEVPSNQIGSVRTYVDDVEVADIRWNKGAAQPPIEHLFVGLYWPGASVTLASTAKAWFDELLLDDAPLTCAQ